MSRASRDSPSKDKLGWSGIRERIGWVQRDLHVGARTVHHLSLLLPVYGREVGADVVQIGLFFSVFSFMNVLLRPMVGWGLDRYGRRPFFLLGLPGYALTMFSFALIDRVWGILLARTLQGIASSLLWLAAHASTADVPGEAARDTAFGSIAQASSQGSIVGTFRGTGATESKARLDCDPASALTSHNRHNRLRLLDYLCSSAAINGYDPRCVF